MLQVNIVQQERFFCLRFADEDVLGFPFAHACFTDSSKQNRHGCGSDFLLSERARE